MDMVKTILKKPDISRERKIMMNTLGLLETLLLANMITAEEYKERKAVYVDSILELYCRDIISKEEMQERLND